MENIPVTTKPAPIVFQEGDQVVLAEGPYKSNTGVFLRLRKDPSWADIQGHDGKVMSHPVEWLAPVATPVKEVSSEPQRAA